MTYTAGGRNTHYAGPALSTTTALFLKARLIFTAQTSASTAWPTAGTAYLIPMELPQPYAFTEAFWISGTSPGTANVDVGVYDENFSLITSIGATASVNSTGALQPAGGKALSPVATLGRGRYYLAMSAAATTITTHSYTYTAALLRAMGVLQMASAHPLPATVTPAAMSATSVPLFGVASVTNLL